MFSLSIALAMTMRAMLGYSSTVIRAMINDCRPNSTATSRHLSALFERAQPPLLLQKVVVVSTISRAAVTVTSMILTIADIVPAILHVSALALVVVCLVILVKHP